MCERVCVCVCLSFQGAQKDRSIQGAQGSVTAGHAASASTQGLLSDQGAAGDSSSLHAIGAARPPQAAGAAEITVRPPAAAPELSDEQLERQPLTGGPKSSKGPDIL